MIFTVRTGEPSYFKCSCQNCGKHIEFPSNGVGVAVACPHCGKQTVLGVAGGAPKLKKFSKKVLVVTLVSMVAIAGAAAAFICLRTPKAKAVADPVKVVARELMPVENTNKQVSQPPMSQPVSQPVSQPAPVADTINDFDLSKISLQKVQGSGLVYAVGTAKNTVDRQRFGVRIELNLLDENDQNVGVVSDYVSVVDPKKDWKFKALLTKPHVAKVTVAGIKEQH